jgi:hypothetical protein
MTRTHMRLTGIALAAGLLLAVFAGPRLFQASLASAQSAPPEVPLVLFGNATGATNGSSVVAVVVNGGSTTTCGNGLIKNDGGLKYVVQVAHDSQIAGCGKAGRTIRLYSTPSGAFSGTGGKMASQSINWVAALTSETSVTFGTPLVVRGFVPLATSDGIN